MTVESIQGLDLIKITIIVQVRVLWRWRSLGSIKNVCQGYQKVLQKYLLHISRSDKLELVTPNIVLVNVLCSCECDHIVSKIKTHGSPWVGH